MVPKMSRKFWLWWLWDVSSSRVVALETSMLCREKQFVRFFSQYPINNTNKT